MYLFVGAAALYLLLAGGREEPEVQSDGGAHDTQMTHATNEIEKSEENR